MQIKNNNLKFIKMKKNTIQLLLLLLVIGMNAQERIKIDGVAVVVGENIVLDSDVEKFKLELEQRSEGKIDFTSCEILEEIMTQKLIAHHAVIDSVEISDVEINGEVDRNIQYFTAQLGTIEKVVEMYGFDDEDDLRTELFTIQREQLLISKERASITENMDVTPEEVRTYFKNLEFENSVPEFSAEIELAQIVKFLKPSEAETKRVLDKLNSIKAELEEGYSFRLKAILNSDDPGVTENGGKYTITRESGFIKEFKEMAFSLDEGEISEPFESAFGFHIILVEKIKGKERDVRHILIQPKISEEEKQKVASDLATIREKIVNGELKFENAVLEYTDEKETKMNKGLILNPQTNDTHFDLTLMDPQLYKRVNNLNAGEITEPFYEEKKGGEKMFKIILLKSKVDAHTAEFVKDYEKIQKLTLQKKQEETIESWAKEKIIETYIKINGNNSQCEFKNNWKKE